jgi:lipopolysaccharide biosynthesis protein
MVQQPSAKARIGFPMQLREDGSRAPEWAPRVIALYLPQFHPVPENDVFWGEGSTEWSTVVRGKPLFPGHYQPRIPADLGFYDLRLPEVRQAQADLARSYGIHGFCYYHYWFKGRRVLDRPFQEVLESGHPDFPFSLCWANHSWRWRSTIYGRARLITQDYSDGDDHAHIQWLLNVFEDERYIKVEGRPLFLIYRPDSMPHPKSTFATWKEEAQKAGVAEPYICKVDSFGNFEDPADYGCDAAVEFWPHQAQKITPPAERAQGDDIPRHVYEYWDNTARVGPEGLILRGSTPQLYGQWLEGALRKVSDNPPAEQLVFVNAWNEWSEGTYLEPDFRYGRAHLEATKRALRETGANLQAKEHQHEDAAIPGPSSVNTLYAALLEKYKRLQLEHTELLAAEENSPLLRGTEKRMREVVRRHQQLQQKYRDMRRTSTQTHRDLDQLTNWMQEIDKGLTALLSSRRWKLISVFVKGARRVRLKPNEETVEATLLSTFSEFRSWLQQSSRRERN